MWVRYLEREGESMVKRTTKVVDTCDEATGMSYQCGFVWMREVVHCKKSRHQCIRHHGHGTPHTDEHGKTPTVAEYNATIVAGFKDC